MLSLVALLLISSFLTLWSGWGPALKINCGPPTANLWSDWSPQKRVNRDKLDQRQNVRKSHFFINSFVYNTTLHPKSPLKICGIWLKFQILTDLSK